MDATIAVSVATACVIPDLDLSPLQQCGGDFGEVFARMARGHVEYPHARTDFVGFEPFAVENPFDALLQRCEMAAKQPGFYAREQVLDDEQSVEFAGVEPQAGQFILLAIALFLCIVIAVAGAIVDERCTAAVA